MIEKLLIKNQPLFLPKGSIRAIITLIVTIAFITNPDNENIRNLLMLAWGFYFGQKVRS
jgi:hypothetical protein